MAKYREVATEYSGETTEASLRQSADSWKCVAHETRGEGSGYSPNEVIWYTEGRGSSPQEAVDALRDDVLAHADNARKRAEHNTMLRQLVYAVEDQLAEDQLSGEN